MAGWKLLLCVCLSCSLWSNTVTQTPPEILMAPQPQLVPFNLGAMVNFTCMVEGTGLIWQINNAQLVTEQEKMRVQSEGVFPTVVDNGDGTISSTLRINVSESNMVNMTRFRCLAVGASVLERSVSEFVNLVTFAIPEPPRNFLLTPSGILNTLTIRWDPPTNTPDVPTTHNVEVVNLNTGEDYPTFPRPGLTLDTTALTFDELVTRCSPFTFRVTATNAAGTSGASIINETIPISPDVTPISDDLRAPNGISVSFSGSEVSITLTFRRAVSCSANFPVLEHITNVEIADSVSSITTNATDDIISVSLDMSLPLLLNSVYTVSVTASSGVTRRTSDAFPVYTTDVQTAMVDYIESDSRVFLTCTFATGATAQGCIFIFTLRNESERFSITREAGTQCNTTDNSADSYDTIQVVDWESDDSEGSLRRTIQPVLDIDERRFGDTCPALDTGLSDGAIAGIVVGIAAAVIISAVVVIVLIVLYYKKRHKLTGEVDTSMVGMAEPDGIEEVDAPLEKQDKPQGQAWVDRYQPVGKLDSSKPSSMKIKLNQSMIQKIRQQSSQNQNELKLYMYYAQP